MAKYFKVSDAIDKNRLSSSAVWVILVVIDVVNPNDRTVVQTIRLARNNETVVFEGDTFDPANFEFNVNQRNGEAPTVSMAVNDQTRIVHKKLDEMAGGVFSRITMKIVNTESIDRPAEMIEEFQVVSSTVSGYVISLQLGAENPLAIQFPKHIQRQDRCAWRYKGYGCDYAGALPKCDYTKNGANGCVQHGNVANFRAIPGLVRMNI